MPKLARLLPIFFKLLFASTLGILALLILANPTYAAISGYTTPIDVNENTATVTLTFTGLNPNTSYDILDRNQVIDDARFKNITGRAEYTTPPVCGDENRQLKPDLDCNTNFNDGDWFVWGTYRYIIREEDCNCNEGTFEFQVRRAGPNIPEVSPSNPRPGDTIRVTLSGSKRAGDVGYRNDYEVYIDDISSGDTVERTITIPSGGSDYAEFRGGFGEGQYRIRIDDKDDDFLYYTIPFTVENDEDGGEIGDPVGGAQGGFPGADDTVLLSGRTLDVVNFLVTFGIGIAGGVAFLLLVYGGFKFMFSMGNPENVQQGREIVTAAIIGLIVIVFSVFLLRLIGISILGLPL